MVRKIQPTPQQDPAAAGADIKDMRQYIIEQEGLDIGKARKRALSQQWRFFLSSEPIQRGMDAGLILGCVTAALSARNPAKRQAPRVAAFWLAGFSVGMIAVPTMVYVADSANSRQIKKKEKELFSRQREDFYNKSKE
jgi:xanthosine utilization system XapX-like protein